MNESAFSQITPHVYWLAPDSTTDRLVLGAITGADRTLIVDAGYSPAHANLLLRKVSEAAIIAELRGQLEGPLDDDHVDLVDEFLAGL